MATTSLSSVLVGHYIEKHGGKVKYYDEHTGDNVLEKEWTQVYLIGYWENYVERAVSQIPMHAVVIDPWRKIDSIACIAVEKINYGDTRKKKEQG